MLRLDRPTLARLFPAYVALGRNGEWRECGPALRRRLGEAAAAVLTPGLPDPDRLAAHARDGSPLHLRLTEPSLHLSGSVLAGHDSFLLAFSFVPLAPRPGGPDLEIADFSPSDPAVPALMLAGIQAALLEETRDSALALARERRHGVELLARFSRASGLLAHEYNNLVSIIGLNCDRLLRLSGDAAADPEERARLVGIIRETVERGSLLTRSLMTLADQRDDSDQVLMLDTVVERHRSLLALLLGEGAFSGVTLVCQLAAPAARVRVGYSALVNALVSLLAIAGEGVSGPTQVTLATRVTHSDGRDMAEITIAAEPVGTRPAVPDPDPARAREEIAAFARKAGGEACFASADALDTAPRARVLLPLVITDGLETAPEPDVAEPAAPLRVLIVDDEPYALEALGELLTDLGCVVTLAACAEEAMAALDAAPDGAGPDVLLTDVVMPGMSGTQLAAEAARLRPSLNVVLMSGYQPDPAAHQPDWQFLRKPINLDRLHALLVTLAG